MKVVIGIAAEIKLISVYTCKDCGAKARGDTVHADITALSSPDLKDQVDALPQRAQHMPVGWASFYAPESTVFKCQVCVANAEVRS